MHAAKRERGTYSGLVLFLAAILVAALLPSAASAQPCEVVDNGTGTVTLPPAGCEYLSPTEVHLIIDGLPPGTTIELEPIHKNFICDVGYGACTIALPPLECEAAGGSLGGNGDCFDSELELQMTGTGDLAGFSRNITIPVFTEVHTGPRNPGDPVQTFPTEMVQLQGQLFGDPDFDFLAVQAGSAFGLPSPGSTTLTELPSGNFNVDSFFDITYQIDFQGAPGSILEGFAGSTQATIQMRAGVPAPPSGNPCEVADNGTGTVTLPPAGCEYLSPDEVHEIINGLPPGTTIELAAIHKDFICRGDQGLGTCSVPLPPGICETPGGSLSGNIDCFDSVAELQLTGSGALGGFSRLIQVPLAVEVHTGPRTPGDLVQRFPNEMVYLEGQIFGDPDFDTLSIRAGSNFGLPSSSGETRLIDQGDGTFNVDSFFDITYQIDFQGAPGGALDGFGPATTTGTIRMSTGSDIASSQLPALDTRGFWAFGLILAGTGALVVAWRRRAGASA